MKRPIEARPTFRVNLPFQGRLDVALAARSELERDALGRPIPKPAADVVPADDEILAIFGTAADQDMNMRIVSVPVVDRDPVQFGSEIPRDVGHQFTGKGAEVAELGGILRRNNKAKMMPVIPAALGESAFVRRLR